MPLLNIDTGHHFPELNTFRDMRAKELRSKLIIRTVEDAVAKGIAVLPPGSGKRKCPADSDFARGNRGIWL